MQQPATDNYNLSTNLKIIYNMDPIVDSNALKQPDLESNARLPRVTAVIGYQHEAECALRPGDMA